MSGIFGRFLRGRTTLAFPDGSSIEYFDREAILYRDASGKQIEIPWYFDKEQRGGKVLYLDTISHWDSPNDRDLLSAALKTELVSKIHDYAAHRKLPLRIVAKRSE